MVLSRRSVMKAAALGAACSAIRPLTSFAADAIPNDDKQFHGLRVGICSYSLRSVGARGDVSFRRRTGSTAG